MFECNIQQCSGGLSDPSEGSGLGQAHQGKPSHLTGQSFRMLMFEQLLSSEGHIFRPCRASAPAGAPIKELPAVALRLFLHN